MWGCFGFCAGSKLVGAGPFFAHSTVSSYCQQVYFVCLLIGVTLLETAYFAAFKKYLTFYALCVCVLYAYRVF